MNKIELQPEAEAKLVAEARARGLSLDLCIVEKLAGSGATGPQRAGSNSGAKSESVSNAIEAIRSLRKGNTLGDLRIKDLIAEGRKY